MSSRFSRSFETWNRKLHYYIGLYFLLFIWLFSLSGILLNHPRWRLARIPNDPSPAFERTVEIPRGDSSIERAADIARQLQLTGEIDLPSSPPDGRFDFNITYPKRATQVKVDPANRRATVQHVERSFWSALRITHTFSGSRYNNAESRRDWILTTVWVVAMDALAAGLLVMVFGSYYMWYRLKPAHALGWTMLAAGYLACGWLLFGFAA